MSDVGTLGVIGALFVAASFLLYRMHMEINAKNHEVETGVLNNGVPVSVKYRWMYLWQLQVPIVLFTAVIGALVGLVFWRIGQSVEDAQIGLLAKLCAWMFFVHSGAYLTSAPVGVLSLASTLRQAGAD